MRMLNAENKISLWNIQLYLTPGEAEMLCDQLNKLLEEPENNEHFHVHCENSGRELSCSLITKQKLSDLSGYSKEERIILSEK